MAFNNAPGAASAEPDRGAVDSPCANGDQDAAAENPAVHVAWAHRHGGDDSKRLLRDRIEKVYRCSAISDSSFAEFYADSSVMLAKTGRTAWCFDGNKAAANQDRSEHLQWATEHSRAQVLSSLLSKTGSIFKCLRREQRIQFHAELSQLIAESMQSADSTRASLSAAPAEHVTSIPQSPEPEIGKLAAEPKDDRTGRGFHVWLKASSCSDTRESWISVAKKNPSTASERFDDATVHFPSAICSALPRGCTYEEASVEADLIRSTAKFSEFCCRDWSVWRNPVNGEQLVAKEGQRPAGSEFSLQVKAGICCDDADKDSLVNPHGCAEPAPQAAIAPASPDPAPEPPAELAAITAPIEEVSSAPIEPIVEPTVAPAVTGLKLADSSHTGFVSKNWHGPNCGTAPACSLTYTTTSGSVEFSWSVPERIDSGADVVTMAFKARASPGRRFSSIASVSADGAKLNGKDSTVSSFDLGKGQAAADRKIFTVTALPSQKRALITINLNRDISFRYQYER